MPIVVCAGLGLALTVVFNYDMEARSVDIDKARTEFTEKDNPVLKEALHALEMFVSEYPHNGADPHMALANARHFAGDLEGTLRSLQSAQSVNPAYESLVQNAIAELQELRQQDEKKDEEEDEKENEETSQEL
jgi:ATP/maltotriose-dependent transcriptional regulator MalT